MTTAIAAAIVGLYAALVIGYIGLYLQLITARARVTLLQQTVRLIEIERDEAVALARKRGKLMVEATSLIDRLQSKPAAVSALDPKTIGLVRLATSNSERNEATNAAFAACEHIARQLASGQTSSRKGR